MPNLTIRHEVLYQAKKHRICIVNTIVVVTALVLSATYTSSEDN